MCAELERFTNEPSRNLAYAAGAPLSESIQHYLRAIYKLQAEEGKVSVTALARGCRSPIRPRARW